MVRGGSANLKSRELDVVQLSLQESLHILTCFAIRESDDSLGIVAHLGNIGDGEVDFLLVEVV